MYCTLQVLHLDWLSATPAVTTIVQLSFFKLSQVSKIIWLSIVDVELAPPCWIRLCCFVVCLVSDQPVFAICKATTASAHQSNLTEASQSLWWNGRTATLPRRWVQGVLQFGFGGVSPASTITFRRQKSRAFPWKKPCTEPPPWWKSHRCQVSMFQL